MTKRSKYGNKKTTVDNLSFDSKAEAKRYSELVILEKAGEIKNLVTQPRYLLQDGFYHEGKKIQAIYYVADFEYSDKFNVLHVEDVKGMKTEVYKIKRKFFLKKYGGNLIFHEINLRTK